MRYKLTATETVAIKDAKGGLDTGTKLTVGGVVYADLKQDQWYRLELGGWVSNLRNYLTVVEVPDELPPEPPTNDVVEIVSSVIRYRTGDGTIRSQEMVKK